MQMFPHERSLVTRLNDKPFALIGINGDRDYGEDYAAKVKDAQISWRSFKNSQGDDKTDIATAWGVEGWPTLYLIDHKGIIRHYWLGSPGDETIDKEVDKLVEEALADAAK